jgi:pimeloyl-ACP methyl ester carboxylesterase
MRVIAGLLALAACTLIPAAELRFRTVEGAGGVPLNVAEAGDASKPAILMIHGIGQSYLSFDRQLGSTLAQDYHLVAFDLRGHGNSGKPWTAEAYKDTAIWAEDVKRVIAATQLAKPVVLGWSYGTAVVADYVRHVGTGNLSGIVLVASLGGLTPPPPALAEPRQAAAFAANRARQASRDLEEQFAAAHLTVMQLTARPMPSEWQERTLMMMSMLPGNIRPLLWQHPAANTDLVAALDVPLLLIGGAKDASVSPPQATQLAAAVRDGRYVNFESAGHSPFAEEPERFNRELDAFARHAFDMSRRPLAAGPLPSLSGSPRRSASATFGQAAK